MSAEGLQGRVAVVTGASSGFGRGIALAYARAGMKVVVADLTEVCRPGNFDEAPDRATASLVADEGGEAQFIRCDVSKAADVDRLISETCERFGRLDVMVNNAGVWRGGPFHEVAEADLDACWNVIVKGSWFGAQAAVRRFLQQGDGGVIINVVSTAGLRGHGGQAPYNVAKAAQANLTRCLALEYGRAGVRVNGICPTYVKTAMSRGGFESAEFNEMVARTNPLGRWGEIEDVVKLAVFLASDASSFIHGALIPLDGGETLGVRPAM